MREELLLSKWRTVVPDCNIQQVRLAEAFAKKCLLDWLQKVDLTENKIKEGFEKIFKL